MANHPKVLRRIDAVLQADLRPEVAYPMRARLGRALLEVGQWLSDGGVAVTLPLDPSIWEALARLQHTSEHIMQPSEPFDSQWRQQWADVVSDLHRVRIIIARAAADDIDHAFEG